MADTAPTAPDDRSAGRQTQFLAAILLVAAIAAAYWPALRGGFIFDDDVSITANPLIRAADGLRRFWFGREAADYWPVSSSALWAEWRLWGPRAAGYHAVNLALHAATCLLLWRTLRRIAVPGAYLAALLFAVHPLNAETVVWATQIKALLALLFALAAAYAFFDARQRVATTWLSLGAAVLAYLSKGSAVILPLLLATAVAWRRPPGRRDWLRLAPLAVAAAACAAYEATFSTLDRVPDARPAALLATVLHAAEVPWFYLGKAVWPARLCLDYGGWAAGAGGLGAWAALVAGIVLTAALWRMRKTEAGRAALWLWLAYLAALVPVLGFGSVGFMRYSPVANHYAHLALVPAALAMAGAIRRLRRLSAGAVPAAAALVAGGFAWLSMGQARIYSDPLRLYRTTIAINPDSWLARTNLGALLGDAGDLAASRAELERAVALRPDFAPAHDELGIALYRLGDLSGAIAEYRSALRLRPDLAEAQNNWGAALAREGRLPEAMAHFRAALAIDPDNAGARRNLERAERLSQ